MLISRAAHRVSICGGGSDLLPFVNEVGGLVVSASINKYSYVTARHLPPFFDHKTMLVYSDIEKVKSHEEIKHRVFKAVLDYLNIDFGVEIINMIDIPSKSGSGSSSTFIVNLLNALINLLGLKYTKEELAKTAIHIEQDILGDNVGSQDHVASSFGGFNLIEFYSSNNFSVTSIKLSQEEVEHIENSLLVFYTKISRSSSEVSGSYNKTKELHKKNINLAEACYNAIEQGNFDKIGSLLNESWQIKKELSHKVSNKFIDDVYTKALQIGILGGKLSGSGGGGNFLFYCPVEKRQVVIDTMISLGLIHIPFRFSYNGVEIIFN